MTHLDNAVRLAMLGWPVFPCEADKTPIGMLAPNGHKDATTNVRKIKTHWKIRPDALIGVAIPASSIAFDVDDRVKFATTGLSLEGLPGQDTPRGGYHRFAHTNGHDVRQTVKTIPGLDTRVGGKGYVIAWQPDCFPAVSDLPDAPEWLYDLLTAKSEGERNATNTASDDVFLTGDKGYTSRQDLVDFAGRLRWAGATGQEIYEALVTAHQNGRIVDSDDTGTYGPWNDKHFKQIAYDLGSKPGPEIAPVLNIRKVKHTIEAIVPTGRISATDLLNTEYPPLNYFVDEILPEGLGIVSGAPKAGKSWLVLQAGIEIASGGELFGRAVVSQRPVLYFALEDGERRLKDRMQMLIGGRSIDLDLLEVRLEARPLGGGFEEDVAKFLDDNYDAYGYGIVIIDVMAKVRPAAKGKDNAYNEDYASLNPMQNLVRSRPGASIIAVTHTRKQGADDFLSTVQGTHGVVGAADWIWAVKRDRLQPEGILNITGRDIHEQAINVVHATTGGWLLSGATPRVAKSDEQQAILDELLTSGDMSVFEIVAKLFPDVVADNTDPVTANAETAKAYATKRYSVNEKLLDLERQHLVAKTGKVTGTPAKLWHALSEDERDAVYASAKARASAATTNTGPTINRVRRNGSPSQEIDMSPSQENDLDTPDDASLYMPPQTPQTPHS